MEVQVGVAKVRKYASSESGDTVETIERPAGGLSVVLVDGQRSGRSAKIISNIVARKAISLLGEGVRDGAAARAAHDYLRTHRNGQVSADLQLLSVDLQTRTIVVSRNTRCPVILCQKGTLTLLDAESEPIGILPNTKPVIVELKLEPDIYLLAYSDGASEAGAGGAGRLDLAQFVLQAERDQLQAQELADQILGAALIADSGRPNDDISIVVLCVLAHEVPTHARRLSVYFPINQV
ncbi:MAG: SpoIIE family protein phosphatase [Anaerolineae bacterium]